MPPTISYKGRWPFLHGEGELLSPGKKEGHAGASRKKKVSQALEAGGVGDIWESLGGPPVSSCVPGGGGTPAGGGELA